MQAKHSFVCFNTADSRAKILYCNAPVTHTVTFFDGELRIEPQSSAEKLRAWPNFLRRSYL